MEHVKKVMELIDSNQGNVSEGDYIELCNRLKEIYSFTQVAEAPYIFDYSSDESERNKDTQIELDMDFIDMQADYILREIELHQPIKRMSTQTKRRAIENHCIRNNLTIEEYTPECAKSELSMDDRQLQKIYDIFKVTENSFREKYIFNLSRKIETLKKKFGELENL